MKRKNKAINLRWKGKLVFNSGEAKETFFFLKKLRCNLCTVQHTILIKHFSNSWQMCVCVCTRLIMSYSLQPHGLKPVNGTFQVRLLKWVATSYSRGSFQPRNWTWVSCISCTGRRILYHHAPWEALTNVYSMQSPPQCRHRTVPLPLSFSTISLEPSSHHL